MQNSFQSMFIRLFVFLTEASRKKRAALARNTCPLLVVADYLFYSSVGGGKREATAHYIVSFTLTCHLYLHYSTIRAVIRADFKSVKNSSLHSLLFLCNATMGITFNFWVTEEFLLQGFLSLNDVHLHLGNQLWTFWLKISSGEWKKEPHLHLCLQGSTLDVEVFCKMYNCICCNLPCLFFRLVLFRRLIIYLKKLYGMKQMAW